jgi:hypothetical protein
MTDFSDVTNFSDMTYVCTSIDNPINLNGNPNLADVVEFSNKSSIDHYHFLNRYTKKVNGIKNNDLFMMLDYSTKLKTLHIWVESQEQLELTIVVNDIKNLKKVGVMTLEDSWLDEKNCTLKRKGSSCKNTIPSELANKGCETIFYNIYDLFYACDYNDSIYELGISGSVTTTKPLASTSTSSTNKTTTTTTTLSSTLTTSPTTTLTSTSTTTTTKYTTKPPITTTTTTTTKPLTSTSTSSTTKTKTSTSISNTISIADTTSFSNSTKISNSTTISNLTTISNSTKILNSTTISNTTSTTNITSVSNLFSKFLSSFIVAVVIIFAFIIPGIGYYIKRKQFDPSSSSIHSIQSSLFNSVPSTLKTDFTIS